MNNAYFGRNNKLQGRNRAGMIRSYRTSRTISDILILVMDMILSAFDRTLDLLARPAIHRVIRGTIALSCIAAFIVLIAAVDAQRISIGTTVLSAAVLVVVELLCLKGN